MAFSEICSQADQATCETQELALTEMLGSRACSSCIVAQLHEQNTTIVELRSENAGLRDQTKMLGALATGLGERLQTAEERNAEINRLLMHDELTGLYSRYALNGDLKEYFAETVGGTYERKAGVGVVDLDHFKHANDLLGHQVGDNLLILAARITESAVGYFGKVYRTGGDEFAILFNRVKELRGDVDGIMRGMADRIERKIVEGYKESPYHDPRLQFGASVGIVRSEPGEYPDELMDRADKAMYAVKMRKRALREDDKTIDLRYSRSEHE